MSMSNTNKRVKEIRRKTRRKFSSEEKIRIVLAGMTTWLAGIPLNEYLPGCTELKAREQIYRQVGTMAARSHRHE
jgi:hypothetical protein